MRPDDDDEGFLSRWSRRKRTGEEDTAPEDVPVAPEQEAEAAPPVDPDEDEAAVLERLGLPDPDSLEQGADFSAFMRAGVPEALRRRALRRLWRSNPTLAVLDGLNDYDDDFSGGFVKPGTLRTAYQVGRGFLERIAADEADEDHTAELREDRSVPVASTLRAPVEERPPAPNPEMSDETADSAEEASAEGDALQEVSAPEDRPARRRMAFRFPDDPA